LVLVRGLVGNTVVAFSPPQCVVLADCRHRISWQCRHVPDRAALAFQAEAACLARRWRWRRVAPAVVAATWTRVLRALWQHQSPPVVACLRALRCRVAVACVVVDPSVAADVYDLDLASRWRASQSVRQQDRHTARKSTFQCRVACPLAAAVTCGVAAIGCRCAITPTCSSATPMALVHAAAALAPLDRSRPRRRASSLR
jgi:hypothetical protein